MQCLCNHDVGSFYFIDNLIPTWLRMHYYFSCMISHLHWCFLCLNYLFCILVSVSWMGFARFKKENLSRKRQPIPNSYLLYLNASHGFPNVNRRTKINWWYTFKSVWYSFTLPERGLFPEEAWNKQLIIVGKLHFLLYLFKALVRKVASAYTNVKRV